MRSGFDQRLAVDAPDQTFGGHIDEFFVVAYFLEFPLECIAQPDSLVPTETVLPAKSSRIRKDLF